jgi:hypothetical protein
VPLRSHSLDATDGFKLGLDLLFIDADHRYEAVRADLCAWMPKLIPNGWLFLHDWGWAEGVKHAIHEVVMPLQTDEPKILPNLYGVRVDSRKTFK